MTASAFWFVQSVTVKPYLGQTAAGGTAYGDAQTVPCWVEDSTKLVRNSEGNEVVSSAAVFADVASAGLFPVGTMVTLPSGRVSKVLIFNVHDSGPLNLGTDHVEVSLV